MRTDLSGLDFGILEDYLETIRTHSPKGFVPLLERMSARPGPLADQALKLARTRLKQCASFFSRVNGGGALSGL